MDILSQLSKASLGVAMVCVAWGADAAVTLDLTTKGATGTINGATYTQIDQQPTGTGVIDPFVRVGMQGAASKDVVQAYNTTVDGVFNNSNEDNWNHAIQFGNLQIQTVGSLQFVRFLLDINQTSANPKLNLDEVQIFISTSPNQSITNFMTNPDGQLNLSSSTLVYRMDVPNAGTSTGLLDDNKVTLDYSLNSGSGSGDLFLDIPVAKFTTAFGVGNTYNTTAKQNNAYVYLYSKFGSPLYSNNDGFEEWAFLAKVAPPDGGGFSAAPEPSSIFLAGIGILAAGVVRKRQRATT